ncbi:MAG: DUF4038 domain-containing protein [Ignisphaera sp.]|nr:DUF4038 domain-containing protein [Ignisphaera sp.]MDW8084828.1 DUF4038 domain-containing protein [Ignisphaera sp.]
MGKVLISETRDYFLKDGEKFFYLADTCWSAFTNASIDEWSYYLEYRMMQGFNALQINVLPQHDRSSSSNYMDPFEAASDGGWNFGRRNEKYFDRAERMVELAVKKDFTPALVLLWCNYVRGTWGSSITPSRIIPIEYVEDYVEYVVDRFGKYNPIFIVSGDTNFETSEAVEYYTRALEIVKRRAPNSLTTMHLMAGLTLPDVFVRSQNLDFYMYQSGHSRERQTLPFELAQKHYSMPIKRPIINGEPCYEGHAHSGKYGRFSNFDVRKAIWQSLLSGAKAGVSYGAHGIWNWHVKGSRFMGEAFSGESYDWRTALGFPGAFDAVFAKWVFERYNLFDIEPANDKLLYNTGSEIRVSMSKDKIVVYTPYNWSIKLKTNGETYRWDGIELASRRVFKPRIEISGDYTIIKMSEFNSDLLIIGTTT